METRRRSARIKSQSDDDESSVEYSSTRKGAARKATRGSSSVSAAADGGTPTRKPTTRGSTVAVASSDADNTPTRRTRSRTKSDGSSAGTANSSSVKPDTPVKRTDDVGSANKKKMEKRRLEVIPEADVEGNDGEVTEAKSSSSSSASSQKKKKKGAANSAATKKDVEDDQVQVNANTSDDANAASKKKKTPKKSSKNITPKEEDMVDNPVNEAAVSESTKKARKSSETSQDKYTKSPVPTSAKKDTKKVTPTSTNKELTKDQESVNDEESSLIKSKSDGVVVEPPKNKPPPPIFETTVHRLRFFKLAPKSILAMTSSPWFGRYSKTKSKHLPLDSDQQQQHDQQRRQPPQLLAISRQGGSVELVDPAERWITVGNVPGVRDREVDALVWIYSGNDNEQMKNKDDATVANRKNNSVLPSLIGASRDGTLFHLDFASKRQTMVIGSGAGGVFCLTTCKVASRGGYFAAGCEDGTIKLYRHHLNRRNGLELVSTLPSAGNAILSLAWLDGGYSQNASGGNCEGYSLGGTVIFAGVADGTIRRFDCVTSVATSSISTGLVLTTSDSQMGGSKTTLVHRWKPTLRMVVENRGLRESTKIWALQALSDGTVISGDSLGNVQFWDGIMGTMLQSFNQSESGADVLCLAVSDNENKVFASGVDTRVMCIQRSGLASQNVNANINPDAAPIRKWINTCAHRKHTHDVRALAICHKMATAHKRKMELLVSGSIDTRLCTYVTNDFKSSRPRIWFNWSSISPMCLSREQRLISVTRSDGVDLYRIHGSNIAHRTEEMDESKCLIQTISITSPFNLTCSTISDDGKLLAASDATALYLFALNVQEEHGILDLNPTKIHLPKECRRPSIALRFDGAQRLVCATVDGTINILRLESSDNESSFHATLEHVFKEHLDGIDCSSYNSGIVGLDISLDGKMLSVLRFSQGKGSVHVFSLETLSHWWSLPEIESTSTCIKFLGEGSLAVGCSNNSFYIFNVQQRELSNWSHDMGLPIVKSLPKELSSRPEPLSRILMTPLMHQKLILVCVQ